MALPGFLGPHTRIAMQPSFRSFTVGPGGALPSSAKLNFTIQPQQQSNWCWAAVSTSVSIFFDAASTWTQCLVANSALPRTDCCAAGASDPAKCNKPWYLNVALQTTGNFASMRAGTLTFAEIQTQVGAGAPVGCRVGWFGGGGHFMTIVGWLVAASGDQYLDIADPIFLNTQIPYSSFATSYQSGGTWSHSYLTQPPTAAVALAGGADRGVDLAFALRELDPDLIGA